MQVRIDSGRTANILTRYDEHKHFKQNTIIALD